MPIFHLPDLGEGLPDAEIRQWHVQEGDRIEVDQALVSMETAKAVVEVPSPYAGIIQKLHGQVGEVIETGKPLVSFASENIASTPARDQDQGSVVGQMHASSEVLDETLWHQDSKTEKTGPFLPAARVLAHHYGLEPSKITSTRSDGIISEACVHAYARASGQTLALPSNERPTQQKIPAPKENMPSGYTALKGARRSMAVSMMRACEQVAAATIQDVARIGHWSKEEDLTVRVLHAMARAAQEEPALNAWYDGASFSRCLHPQVHIGLALDLGEDGLVVPVLRNVEEQSASSLRAQISEFKEQGRRRGLSPEQLSGATILYSNFGSLAGRHATPVVLPPTVAILASGRSFAPFAEARDQSHQKILPLSLSFDHRAVTGGEAARFLGHVIAALEA